MRIKTIDDLIVYQTVKGLSPLNKGQIDFRGRGCLEGIGDIVAETLIERLAWEAEEDILCSNSPQDVTYNLDDFQKKQGRHQTPKRAPLLVAKKREKSGR